MRLMGAVRVSSGAIKKLNEVLTEQGLEIAKFALEIADHNDRKTVQEDDIKLAAQK